MNALLSPCHPVGPRSRSSRRELDWRRGTSLDCMTADRSLIARLAAHESWAKTTDPSARTAPARRALLDRFERQVDPDGVLSPAERARRAGHARKAYFARLALRSAQARRARRQPSKTGTAVRAGWTRANRTRRALRHRGRRARGPGSPNVEPACALARPPVAGTDTVSGGRGAPSGGLRGAAPETGELA